jgi:branched-chain amino acid transport system ATP-binding protein
MLEIKHLTKTFGGLTALNDVDLQVYPNEILGLIGPNGAGKSTMFNLITGMAEKTRGQVIFEGKDISALQAHEIARLGIDQSFQSATLLNQLTALDNVFVGYHMRYRTSMWKRILRSPAALREERAFRENALEILQFMGIDTLKDEQAENLSHGHQKVLGVCMALATNPKLLLLDEPVAGMSSNETQAMIDLIRKIKNRGVTIVVVEHDMKVIRSLCDRIVVLSYGRKLMEGQPKEVMENAEVIEAYLGKEEL